MEKIHLTTYGYYIDMPDGKTILRNCDGTDEEKIKMAEEDIQNYSPQPEPEPAQLDRIEESVINTALTTEYMACLQEINYESM